MTLLADTRAAAGELALPGTVRRADVAPALLSAWDRLAPGARHDIWAGTLDERAHGTAAPHPVIVIEHAPGSQFAALQAALRAGTQLPDDLTCVALAGDGFRGQRGRSWAAVRGNLHVCRLARVDAQADAVQAALTALPAVACAVAIERASDGAVTPGIKWVNDVLLYGHKVGGVISATQVASGRVTYALFGIGVNVRTTPVVERDPRVPPAGSLLELVGAAAPTLRALTVALLAELDRTIASLRAGAGSAVVAEYRARSLTVGRRVAIWPVGEVAPPSAPERTGTVLAIRDDLGLELGDGSVVHAGRLTFLD